MQLLDEEKGAQDSHDTVPWMGYLKLNLIWLQYNN